MTNIDFHSRIKTKLQEISEIAFVYSFENSDPEGFPFVVVKAPNISEKSSDSVSNERTYKFKILGFVPFGDSPTVEEQEGVEVLIMGLQEKIADKLNKIKFDDLGGFFPKISFGNLEYSDIACGKSRVLVCEVEVVRVVSILS